MASDLHLSNICDLRGKTLSLPTPNWESPGKGFGYLGVGLMLALDQPLWPGDWVLSLILLRLMSGR